MNRCLKCSKFSETGEHENMDRISTLPDELLGYMLSFLPTDCAVSTSILSSRWRCLHMLTNCLSFDAPYCGSEEEGKMSPKKSFKMFANRVLLFHKVSPIKYFHLDCGGFRYDDSYLHAWISAAIQKGVEQLHLRFEVQFNPLPLCLFSCQTIVELKIYSCIRAFRVPESVHLPSLKILDLKNIHFVNSESFVMLFSACPLLQELVIELCEWPTQSDCHVRLLLGELKHLTITNYSGRFEVDAPNLIYLNILGTYGKHVALSLEKADSLVTAHLEFTFIDFPVCVQFAVALIKAVYHVKELYVLDKVLQYLTNSGDDHMPSYPNLLKPTIAHSSYDDWKYIMHWLANSPRLETLILNKGLISTIRSRDEKWPPNVALAPFSSSVKEIEVSYFRGFRPELFLVKYLLRNAGVLKRLILYQDTENTRRKQEIQASRRMLMFPRASRTCVVRVRNADYL